MRCETGDGQAEIGYRDVFGVSSSTSGLVYFLVTCGFLTQSKSNESEESSVLIFDCDYKNCGLFKAIEKAKSNSK